MTNIIRMETAYAPPGPYQEEINRADVPYGYEVTQNGLRIASKDEEKLGRRISNAVWVVAITRDYENESFGRRVIWLDNTGETHCDTIADKDLIRPEAILTRLADGGIGLAGSKASKDDLIRYLSTAKPRQTLYCTSTTGWTPNLKSFVLPDRTIGERSIVYQGQKTNLYTHNGVSGTLQDWQNHVGALCAGNSRLILGVCAALTGPTLRFRNQENIGAHITGRSSQGKSTVLDVAASVWGPPKFKVSWNTTATALESVAMARNDSALILDEINEVSTFDISNVIYMLGNGHGKARANSRAEARPVASWRCCTLSSGEKSPAELMKAAKLVPTAGLEARLLCVPAEPAGGIGVFETIHDCCDGAAFSDLLKASTAIFYGSLGEAYLNKMVAESKADPNKLAEKLHLRVSFFTNLMIQENGTGAGLTGQVLRAAGAFGQIYAAGALACEWGLLPWEELELVEPIQACFEDWLKDRGDASASSEILAGVQQLVDFFTRYCDSRFQRVLTLDGVHQTEDRTSLDKASGIPPVAVPDDAVHITEDRIILDKVGYYAGEGKKSEFWITHSALVNIVLAGHSFKEVKKLLVEKGALAPKTQQRTIDGKRVPRLYIFKHQKLLDFFNEEK